MIAMIGTWKMCQEGLQRGLDLLQAGAPAGSAVTEAIMQVENEPLYTSVGYGGLPDKSGHVTMDAAYMDGHTLRMGAVMAVEGVKNPILAAQALCGRETNCLLAGRGAEQFAIAQGLEMRDMLTENARDKWLEALQSQQKQKAYEGHDTVCVIAMDKDGHLVTGTSTSGLFMKECGRVGDSPIIGSGFYCDDTAGAAAATGLGEDIMRGCLSYEAVSLIRNGMHAQAACEAALNAYVKRKALLGEDAGSISLIGVDKRGSCGAATTLRVFPFVGAVGKEARLFAAWPEGDKMRIAPATVEELAGEP